MLIVLADDFSGAAEIGGIGHRYGLSTEIQLQFDPSSTADLIVVDTDTRSMQESDAVKKIEEISHDLKKSNLAIKLFKKVDSVMRGHLIPEINVLRRYFNYNKVLLLPANPGRGRKIIAGNYVVNGISLEKTVFANDPDFPITSSSVEILLRSKPSDLKHVHLTPGNALPTSAIVTGEVESKDDLKKYLLFTNEFDLCCGAAELFESYLENLGYSTQTKKSLGEVEFSIRPYALIINGSTVKNQSEIELYEKLNTAQVPFPGEWQGSQFKLEKDEVIAWYQKILNSLSVHHMVVTSIEHPVQHSKISGEIFLNRFVEMMHYITRNIPLHDIHFCLTGGATASSIMRNSAPGKLKVKDEIVSGVVTLGKSRKDEEGLAFFTVKPGSYSWPVPFIEHLITHKRK
jgi:uncharacterized protein YgbK (DUF1537 family)